MALSAFRGLLIAAFFAIVAFILVPLYVPRPAFIPGFAPPPDMWPRLVSLIGIVLGLAATFMPADSDPDIEQDDSPLTRKLGRIFGAIASFLVYLGLVPEIGFMISTMLLTLAIIAQTGERKRIIWSLIVGVPGTALVMMFFQSALGTQFPVGALIKSLGL